MLGVGKFSSNSPSSISSSYKITSWGSSSQKYGVASSGYQGTSCEAWAVKGFGGLPLLLPGRTS